MGEIGETLTMEHALLLTFMGVSAYMVVGAFEFSSEAALFPWFTAGVVIVLGALVLLRSVLPAPMRRFVVDEVDVLETGGEEFEGEESEADDDEEEETVAHGAVVTGGLCVGYLVGSYLFGMLWVTPLFVVGYTYWRRQPVVTIVGLSVLSFVIAFVFYWVLNLPIEEGLIQELLL